MYSLTYNRWFIFCYLGLYKLCENTRKYLLSIIYYSYCRSITKILGEWWANLDKEEKSCYTSLAKQVINFAYVWRLTYVTRLFNVDFPFAV